MRALFGVAAERIEQDRASGRLSIIGVFHEVSAASFPHIVENLGVAARFELDAEEYGKEATANVALVDPSGHRNHRDQRPRLLPGIQVGRPTFWDFAINLPRLDFEGPGRFDIVLRVEKQVVAEIPIWVVQAAGSNERSLPV